MPLLVFFSDWPRERRIRDMEAVASAIRVSSRLQKRSTTCRTCMRVDLGGERCIGLKGKWVIGLWCIEGIEGTEGIEGNKGIWGIWWKSYLGL